MKWPFNIFRKESAVGKIIAWVKTNVAIWTPRNYEKFAEEAYIRNVIAYRCIRLIAEAASSIPWLIYRGKEEVSDHPLHRLLTRPNRDQGGAELWDAFFAYLQIAGNTYLEAVTLDGSVEELYVLRPDRMKIVPSGTGRVGAFKYGVNGQEQVFTVPPTRTEQSPILHMKLFHPLDDWYGLSPVEPSAFSVDVHNAASGFNKAMIDNVATPSGALQTDDDLSNEQYERLQDDLTARQGVKGAGKPLLLEGGLKWQPMSMSPKEMDFTEGKREAAREVALGFGVPPMLLGIPGDSTYSNYMEANRAFYRQTVLPLMDKTCDKLSVFFEASYGRDIRVGYDPDGIEALAAERKELWDRLRLCDFLQVDEKRLAAGYEDLPNGEGKVVIVSATDIPLDQAGSLQAAQAEQAKRPPAPKPATPPPAKP